MRAVGLGGAPGEWADYEWVRLHDRAVTGAVATGPAPARARRRGPDQRVAAEPPDRPDRPDRPDPLGTALCAWAARTALWEARPGPRLLLVDLDNLRAGPTRWRARMALAVAVGREADVVALAGQEGPVERALPHLAELGDHVVTVGTGHDLADLALLEAAADVPPDATLQVVLMSNDNIFTELAQRGRLVVLSPGAAALSERLDSAAADVVDLAALEEALTG